MGLLPATISKFQTVLLILILSVGDLSEKNSNLGKPNRNDFPRTDELLNPSLKCGFQVQEILLQHTDLSTSETKGDTFAIRESKT
jgi:peptide/nickel transport system ATP-binding protein